MERKQWLLIDDIMARKINDIPDLWHCIYSQCYKRVNCYYGALKTEFSFLFAFSVYFLRSDALGLYILNCAFGKMGSFQRAGY